MLKYQTITQNMWKLAGLIFFYYYYYCSRQVKFQMGKLDPKKSKVDKVRSSIWLNVNRDILQNSALYFPYAFCEWFSPVHYL